MNHYKNLVTAFCFLGLCFFSCTSTDAQPKNRTRRKRTKRHLIKRTNVPKIYPVFSKTVAHYPDWVTERPNANTYIWQNSAPLNFDELILSWNARRPALGFFTFWVSVKHHTWSSWHRIAEWGNNYQQTFVNKLNPYVHTKHVRVEMQRGLHATDFRIKVVFNGGAPHTNLHALFVTTSRLKQYRRAKPDKNKPTILIRGIPKQSQMVLDHHRSRELCSPTSLAMIIKYFQHMFYDPLYMRDLHTYAASFANKVHDDGYLDIYGSWPLNVAQAYEASEGDVFYSVQRLNSFDNLYEHLKLRIPIAVSVRRLKGGATPYAGGHFVVVVGWDQPTQSVLCIDPAFGSNKATYKKYKITNFLRAWGLSNNLAYVPIPKKIF